jgi:hypothetical protein
MTPLRFASARRGLLAQRTFTSKSRAMLGAQILRRSRDARAPLFNSSRSFFDLVTRCPKQLRVR